jgi:hypothetical protein
MKLILFILITTLVCMTCSEPKLCKNENDQYVFHYWKIEFKKDGLEAEGLSLNGLKSEVADGTLQTFYLYNRIDLKLKDDQIIKFLFRSVDYNNHCYDFKNHKENCILEFLPLLEDEQDNIKVYIHLKFVNPQCIGMLQLAFRGISTGNYMLYSTFVNLPDGNQEVVNKNLWTKTGLSFNAHKAILNLDSEKIVALDISFFTQENKVTVEYIIDMVDNKERRLFYFDFGECGRICVESLRSYVYGSLLDFHYNSRTDGLMRTGKGNLRFDLENNIVTDGDELILVKIMEVADGDNIITLKGYIKKALPENKIGYVENLGLPIEYKYEYIDSEVPYYLLSELIFAKYKFNKQQAVNCPNSIFTYWKKVRKQYFLFKGFQKENNDNSLYVGGHYTELENGTIEVKEGKIIIKDIEYIYLFSTTNTNLETDQAMVEIYYIDIVGEGGKANPAIIKRLDLYFSLAEDCKEKLIKTLKNKAACASGLPCDIKVDKFEKNELPAYLRDVSPLKCKDGKKWCSLMLNILQTRMFPQPDPLRRFLIIKN